MRPHGLYSPWNSPSQNTRVGSLSLLQGIFPTQGTNPGLPHCRWILYQLNHKGSPAGTDGKASACNAGDLGSISGLGRSPGEGKGCPLQYSGLENSMDCIVRGVTESNTTDRLSLTHSVGVGELLLEHKFQIRSRTIQLDIGSILISRL